MNRGQTLLSVLTDKLCVLFQRPYTQGLPSGSSARAIVCALSYGPGSSPPERDPSVKALFMVGKALDAHRGRRK